MSDDQPSGMNPALKIVLIVAAILCVLVCGVVGVLGWIVKGNVERFESQAAVSTTEAQMRHIESAIQVYRIENRALPPTLDALVGPAGYIGSDEVPTDAWNFDFFYEPGEDGRSFELISWGSDGVEGGEGNAADITRDTLQQR